MENSDENDKVENSDDEEYDLDDLYDQDQKEDSFESYNSRDPRWLPEEKDYYVLSSTEKALINTLRQTDSTNSSSSSSAGQVSLMF